MSLAAQRFLASVLDEAANSAKRRRLAPVAHLRAEGHDVKDPRLVLGSEDLAEALKEVGGRGVGWGARRPHPFCLEAGLG